MHSSCIAILYVNIEKLLDEQVIREVIKPISLHVSRCSRHIDFFSWKKKQGIAFL